MSVTATFLHSRPQREIASTIRNRLAGCRTAEIVSGFATPDGVDALRAKNVSNKIKRLVLGAGTFKAFEALDGLINSGLPTGAARVHLGHTRATGGRKHPFARYRPMLHSKIYFFEMPDRTATAFVGSHNLTGFALRGLNGEAGVLLEGTSSDRVFDEVRGHIVESFRQAVPYDPSLKAAYAQWLRDYLEQLGIDATDMPRDDESRRTVILFAEAPQGRMPSPGDRIYFELDMRITEVNSIDTEVHLHLFAAMPATPAEALSRSAVSDTALLGKVEAIDSAAGSAEVKADWFIEDPTKPQLKRTVHPFRPMLSPGKQQVRALVSKSLEAGFDYLFDAGKGSWKPTLSQEKIRDEETNVEWSAVIGLGESSPVEGQLLISDLREMSPESGSFVLFSRRRRRLGVRKSL
jgi:HKD family nuclease